MLSALTLLALHWVAPAVAAPVGDPVPLPEAGRVRLDARVGSDLVQETDTRCKENSGCGADWHHTSTVGGLHIAVLKGLGVYGEFGFGRDRIQAADYRGRSQVWAAGVRTAVPVGKTFWIAANARIDHGNGESLLASEDPEISTYRIYSGTLVGVIGDGTGGVSAWAGAQSSWHWDHHVWPLGTRRTEVHLDVPLAPKLPASAVLGFGLTSDPVGLPWRKTSRLTVAVEGRGGQEWGASAWLGLAL